MSCANCFAAFLLPSLGDQCSKGKLQQWELEFASGNGWWEQNGIFLFMLWDKDFALQGTKTDGTVIRLGFTVDYTLLN